MKNLWSLKFLVTLEHSPLAVPYTPTPPSSKLPPSFERGYQAFGGTVPTCALPTITLGTPNQDT
uniref:Uncharacterized protein n=1 Tax=Prolemur simus TaxID=1328070 RepID=A0A8C9DN77_PROSS